MIERNTEMINDLNCKYSLVLESFSTASKKNLMVLRENIFRNFKYQFYKKTTILFYNIKIR